MYGWMDGWLVVCMYAYACKYVWIHACIMDGWMHGCMDEWMGGWVDGWMNE